MKRRYGSCVQSKAHSVVESVTNVIVGYLVAFVSQLVIFPMFRIEIPITDNLAIALWFTVISLIRSYLLRRSFTRITE